MLCRVWRNWAADGQGLSPASGVGPSEFRQYHGLPARQYLDHFGDTPAAVVLSVDSRSKLENWCGWVRGERLRAIAQLGGWLGETGGVAHHLYVRVHHLVDLPGHIFTGRDPPTPTAPKGFPPSQGDPFGAGVSTGGVSPAPSTAAGSEVWAGCPGRTSISEWCHTGWSPAVSTLNP